MNRRHFLKSLAAIPFLGFFENQPVAKLDLIIEGMEVSDILEQTEPVIEATAKQTVYFTSDKAVTWNGQSWSQLKQEKEVEVFGGLDEVITTGHRLAIWNDNSWEAYRNGLIKFDSDGEIHIFEDIDND